jgi:transposase
MRGKKGREHFDAQDPPRYRGNKRRGHGTMNNDRPPVLGTVGRESGQVRLRVATNSDLHNLTKHVEQFTLEAAQLYTDEYWGYNRVQRERATVSHLRREWARDDDQDGIREVHVNTIEGLWTGLRNFLRPFRGVSKHFLSGYVAIYEFRVNLKKISRLFIASLVHLH